MNRTQIPPAALDDPDAIEVVSAWLASGKSHVSLNLGWGRSDSLGDQDIEDAWGFFLADLTLHVTNALSQKSGYPQQLILERLRAKMDSELDQSTANISGTYSDDAARPPGT